MPAGGGSSCDKKKGARKREEREQSPDEDTPAPAKRHPLPRAGEGVCNAILVSMGKAARDESMNGGKRGAVAKGGCPGGSLAHTGDSEGDDEADTDKEEGEEEDGEELNLDSIISRAPFRSMIQELFCDDSLAPPPIPVITKSYEESYMREPVAPDERACVMDSNCECNIMCREDGFIAVEMLMPNEKLSSNANRQMCVLCLRKATQVLYYELIYSGLPYRGIIQKYGVICGQPFEYAKEVRARVILHMHCCLSGHLFFPFLCPLFCLLLLELDTPGCPGVPGVSPQRAGRMHALPHCEPPEEQVQDRGAQRGQARATD